MISSNDLMPDEFVFPAKIKYLVCCDLDETYIPLLEADKKRSGIYELERFLDDFGEKKGIVIGWITGTNLASAIRKSSGYITRSPHFICSSLGTELHWIRKRVLIPCESWREKIRAANFSTTIVHRIVADARDKGILLVKQPEDYQGPLKLSYYFHDGKNARRDFAWLEEVSSNHGVRVLMTRCNPAAGDPADCHDIDFVPMCGGKDYAVDFVSNQLDVPRERVLAFGDSCNDFPMFSRSGHSFLVGNAEPSAKESFRSSLNESYCEGILNVLRSLS